ncbi:MAG: DUF1592 domain-containing protein, partial [Myxococcales bacterium]|nr:DUF1592 domain-containing protein [Myxococcales bacterium]
MRTIAALLLAGGLSGCVADFSVEYPAAPSEAPGEAGMPEIDRGGPPEHPDPSADAARPGPDARRPDVPPAADGAMDPPPDDLPPFAPAAATLHRLTFDQYRNSIVDLFGVEPPADLEVDTPLHGFAAIGATDLTISPRAAEQYETAAMTVVDQIFGDAGRRAALVGCDAADPACARAFIERSGRLIWRRPLQPAEAETFAELARAIGEQLRDPWRGLGFAVAGLLQSPDFLFRVERGEPDPDRADRRRFTDHEMAERLSFLLWNSTPDEALLDAADRGELTDAAGLQAAAERLLDDPRARAAVGRFFAEYLSLDKLDHLEKDRAVFPQMSETLGAAMRAEIAAVIDDLVFTRDADLRDLLTTRQTFIDPELAALYQLPAVDDFGPVTLPADGPRAGLMGMAGVLALNAHNTVTSPTHRGKYVQSKLLCFDIPPPPPGVATNLDAVGQGQAL